MLRPVDLTDWHARELREGQLELGQKRLARLRIDQHLPNLLHGLVDAPRHRFPAGALLKALKALPAVGHARAEPPLQVRRNCICVLM